MASPNQTPSPLVCPEGLNGPREPCDLRNILTGNTATILHEIIF